MVFDWNNSKLMIDRLDQNNSIEEIDGVLYYQGRRVITRDTPIDGGVYLGKGAREAIVVDSTKYEDIKKLYEKTKIKLLDHDELSVLKSVYDAVHEAMPLRNGEFVENAINTYCLKNDTKITLDFFIRGGFGVCRHRALAVGVLLELFKKEGFLKGKISIDRNHGFIGGHAWCRYTSPDGKVFIIDEMLEYLGKLSDANTCWDYRRPEDA